MKQSLLTYFALGLLPVTCKPALSSDWVEDATDRQVEHRLSAPSAAPLHNMDDFLPASQPSNPDVELLKHVPYLQQHPNQEPLGVPPGASTASPAIDPSALQTGTLPPMPHPSALQHLSQDVRPVGSVLKRTGKAIVSPTGLAVGAAGAAAGVGIWALADKNMFLRKWFRSSSPPYPYGNPYTTTYGTNYYTAPNGSPIYYQGYRRRNGTWVGPHWQTAPDGTMMNNYSTLGNINPTGRTGWIVPSY